MRSRCLALLLSLSITGCASTIAQPQSTSSPSSAKDEGQALSAVLPVPKKPQSKTIKIYLSVASLDELKIAEGQPVAVGQVLVDRAKERALLISQKQRVDNQIELLQSKKIFEPNPPKPLSQIASLPPAHYEEQQAAIDKAINLQKQANQKLDLKKREIDFLKGQPDNDPAILEHEGHQLEKAQQEASTTTDEIDLARGKLEAAKQERAYKEYERQLSLEHQEEAAQAAAQNYERSRQEFIARQQQHEIQMGQLEARAQDLEQKLAEAPLVVSPYMGMVKKLRFKYQNESKITVELELAVNPGFLNSPSSRSSQNPGQQPITRPTPPIDSQETPQAQGRQLSSGSASSPSNSPTTELPNESSESEPDSSASPDNSPDNSSF